MGRTACTEPQCLYKGALYLYLYLYLLAWQCSGAAVTRAPPLHRKGGLYTQYTQWHRYWGWGQVLQPLKGAESKGRPTGRKNKHFELKKIWFSALNTFNITESNRKIIQ